MEVGSPEIEIIHLERLILIREFASDVELSALLVDDFVEFGRSGLIYGKQEVLGSLIKDKADLAPSNADIDHVLTRLLADGVVLLTYRSFRRGANGQRDRLSLRSSIWRRTDERWQMCFHQGTPID